MVSQPWGDGDCAGEPYGAYSGLGLLSRLEGPQLGMKTVKSNKKALILVLVSFYNNGTKTKMLRSVYGIEIIGHSKTKICRKDQNMINLSVIDKTNNKLN
jgi:hypothetical protein